MWTWRRTLPNSCTLRRVGSSASSMSVTTGQRLVVDGDLRGRGARLLERLGGDDARPARPRSGRRPSASTGWSQNSSPNVFRPGTSAAVSDGSDAGRPRGGGDVDRADPRRRVRAADGRRPRACSPRRRSLPKAYVARHLRDAVDAARALADAAAAGVSSTLTRVLPRRGGPRRGSSGSRCSGRGCRRAPRGSSRRSGRVALEQVGGGDDHPRRAEAALDRAGGEERLLHRVERSPSASDSTVRTTAPSACDAGTRQAQTTSPSSQTEQEPHSPCSHAFFEPASPSSSRSSASRLAPRPDVDLALDAVHGRPDQHARLLQVVERPAERALREHLDRVPAVGAPSRGRRRSASRRRPRAAELGDTASSERPVGLVPRERRRPRTPPPRARARRSARPSRARAGRRALRRRAGGRRPAIAITIALRVPTFANEPGPVDRGATRRRGSARPARASCASGRRRTRATARDALPAVDATTTSRVVGGEHGQRRRRPARRCRGCRRSSRGSGSAASRPSAPPRRAGGTPASSRSIRANVTPAPRRTRPFSRLPRLQLVDAREVEQRRRPGRGRS